MQPTPPTPPFIKRRVSCRESAALTPSEAVSMVAELATGLLKKPEKPDPLILKFRTKKLVADVLAFCNRADFPFGLIYTAAELVARQFESAVEETTGAAFPLKKLKQDDTEFTFAVADVTADAAGLAADLDFETIKPKLILYRKVRAL